MEPKRYDLVMTDIGYEMAERDEGEYVRYDDHKATIAALRERVSAWIDDYLRHSEGCCRDDIPFPDVGALEDAITENIDDPAIVLALRKAKAFDAIASKAVAIQQNGNLLWMVARNDDYFPSCVNADLLTAIEEARKCDTQP